MGFLDAVQEQRLKIPPPDVVILGIAAADTRDLSWRQVGGADFRAAGLFVRDDKRLADDFAHNFGKFSDTFNRIDMVEIARIVTDDIDHRSGVVADRVHCIAIVLDPLQKQRQIWVGLQPCGSQLWSGLGAGQFLVMKHPIGIT